MAVGRKGKTQTKIALICYFRSYLWKIGKNLCTFAIRFCLANILKAKLLQSGKQWPHKSAISREENLPLACGGPKDF